MSDNYKLVDTQFGPEWQEAVAELANDNDPERASLGGATLVGIKVMQQELEDLRAWKREALLVESTWDEQAVGRALGMVLGCSVRPRILSRILRLKFTIEALLRIMTMQGYVNTSKVLRDLLVKERVL